MCKEFLSELVDNYSIFFQETRNIGKYPNQDITSCTALYDLCVSIDPDFVIDIGTNLGASTLSFALALKAVGKPLSLLTTIDKNQVPWREETPIIQQSFLKKGEIEIEQINVIEADFLSLDPLQFLRDDVKGLVFYDIHDTNLRTFSEKFLYSWVSLLGKSVVAIHDCSLVPKSHILRENYNDYTMTKQTHFSGKTYAGFNECKSFIEWANEKRYDIFDVPETSIIYFKFNDKRILP